MSAAEWIAERRELLAAATEPADRIAIPSCPGYSATRDGEVWSEESNWRGMGPRPLVPVPAAGGYLKVRVNVNGNRTNRKVHRLVAEAFFGPCPEGAQVRHLDGDKANNAATNLAYGTAKENADDREAHGTTARGHRNGYSKRFDGELVQRVVWLHLAGLSNRQIETYVSLGREAVGLVLAENAQFIADARTSLPRALHALEAVLEIETAHVGPDQQPYDRDHSEGWNDALSAVHHAAETALRGDSLAVAPKPRGESIDAAHIDRQRGWSAATFGPGPRLNAILDHIGKEMREIAAQPLDLFEWVDVIILALDGAWRAGWESQQIIDAIREKQAHNEARSWPDWRTSDPDRAIEHIHEATP